jgi:division protein CdvB (Snf7/Vps24/ESCRT-III family)
VQAIQKGNMEGAKIHAENSIRQKNQALNYRRMSARIDAVASRVQTAMTTRQVTQSMAGVVKAMESAMKSMNLEKVKIAESYPCLCITSSHFKSNINCHLRLSFQHCLL